MKRLLAIASLLALPGLAAAARDITAQVRAYSSYDEQVAAACTGYCGNRGSSRLDQVLVVPLEAPFHEVTALATVIYHQFVEAPKPFGVQLGSGVNLRYPMRVRASGILHGENCKITVTDVEVIGDELGLTRGMADVRGQQYVVENCARLLQP